MKPLCTGFFILAGSLVLAGRCLAATPAAKDLELFNQGKVAIFDKNWEGARGTFQRVIQEFPQSALVPQAYYFIARCYQFEGKNTEAVRAYDTFLQKYPNEPFLPSEARNAVVELSATLMEKGDATYRSRLVSSLSSPEKEVRYFAAIRCSRLEDSHITSMALPVLREIVKVESDRDLADRARIALLRLDSRGLAPTEVEAKPRSAKAEKSQKSGDQRLFHLVVYKTGSSQPAVELNLPVSFAQLAIAALDESTKAKLRKEGVDIDNVWESLKGMGRTNILTIRDGENLIKLWIE